MSCTVVIKDKNLKPENIKMGITILKVTGTFEGNEPALEEKTVNSSTLSQEVLPGEGFDGLSKVTVNPYTLDSKTVNSSTSQQTVTSSADGLSSVTVEPYTLDTKTVDPSTSEQTVTSSADGLSSVTVNAVTSSIDSNIQADNIKKDVTILGVTGTYESASTQPNLQDVSVTYLSNGNYTVSASDGYDGLGTVDVSVNIDGAKNWIIEARLGNITDVSGYSIAELAKKYGGADSLFINSNITSIPRIQDTVDNPNGDVGEISLKQTFSGCGSLQSVDMSVGSVSNEGMHRCFAESGVRDVSINISSLSGKAFLECFQNCSNLSNLYIKVASTSLEKEAFRDLCYGAGKNDDNTTITIEGPNHINSSTFYGAFYGMHTNDSGGITVNLPDNLVLEGGIIGTLEAFSQVCKYSHFTDKTTPSFFGKLNYVKGNFNFANAFAVTNVETATLGFNTCSGISNFENALGSCQNLREVTFDGSFNVSGSRNMYWLFDDSPNLTSMICTSTAGTKPFRYNNENNVAGSAPNITDVTIDNVNSDVYLLWNPSVNAASVYGILSKAAGATVQEGDTKTISFYSSGLTVTDFEDGRIQTAYNAAVADGWTINNLTINPHV